MITKYSLIDAYETKTLFISLELLESMSIIDRLANIN